MRVDWCVSSWFRIKNTHSHVRQVYFIFAWAGLMLKFWKNPAGPCEPLRCPNLPTYLPTLLMGN